ncbi:MAG: ribosomal subunit interface protein [Pirellulaceae bacterium]|nr:ribosomal subunit interface protein [Pirellulaceae bacterium]
MIVQVKTDNHIQGSTELTAEVEEVLENALARFRPRITRVEVHFSDVNSQQKHGDNDKRCVMEARLAGLKPVAISHHGSTVAQAMEGAAETLQQTLLRTLRRLEHAKGRTSYAGEQDDYSSDVADEVDDMDDDTDDPSDIKS